jgi:hypothetical protein
MKPAPPVTSAVAPAQAAIAGTSEVKLVSVTLQLSEYQTRPRGTSRARGPRFAGATKDMALLEGNMLATKERRF